MEGFECRRCQELNTNVGKGRKRNGFTGATVSSQARRRGMEMTYKTARDRLEATC